MNISRTFYVSALSAAVLSLAACGSSVKLDESASGPAPIIDASRDGANGSGASSNQVTPVVIDERASDSDATGLARVIYFDFDSFVVKSDYADAVGGHAKRLNAAKGQKVIIEGHTDERGGREYNLALGQKRAEAVQKSLSLLGVSADQVEAVSFGEERPAAEGAGEAAWAENRRAEIKDR